MPGQGVPTTRPRWIAFTDSGPRDDISAIVRRQAATVKRENGRFAQRRAARGAESQPTPCCSIHALSPSRVTGSERTRLPVAAKIAFANAGAITEVLGSPMPPGRSPPSMIATLTFGISASASIR